MKKNLIAVIIIILFSCSKKSGSGDYCWRCEVSGGVPYREFIKDTCTREDQIPAFYDENNNPMNEFCTRR